MARPIDAPPLARHQSGWVLLASFAAVAPLGPYLPPAMAAVAALLLAGRAWLVWRERPLPPRWLPILFALAWAVGVGLQFRSVFGKDPGVTLLAGFLASKLLEMRGIRDAWAVLLLDCFLILSLFFYTQTMAAATAMAVAVVLVTAALANLANRHLRMGESLRLAGSLLAQATPFMLVLFVLFPRVTGPLWGLPVDAYSGMTGLSDTMSPGTIERLVQSDAIAFRARFPAAVPERARLYWRGPVLTTFDGRTWHSARSTPTPELTYATGSGGIDYEVTLEPNDRRWLFALEWPVTLPADSAMSPDYMLLARRPVRARLRYALRSRFDMVPGRDETPAHLQAALQLPAQGNPRARQLAAQLRAEAESSAGKDGRAVVQALLTRFARGGYTYTLEPPLLGRDSVDEFLFDTRRGFCEHFAGSFVFVMRAAGIPARVVTGYQGGEINPVDGYMEVRQYDAHAWAEVWLPEAGWQRVDPTAAIAPSRVEANLAAAIPVGETVPLLERPAFSWLRELRYRWDAVSNGWNQWVLGYNPQRQRDLLQGLGMRSPDWQSMTAALAGLSGLLMLGLTAWALRRHRPADPVQAAWQRLSRKLRRRGLERQPWEGPRDYALRISAALPARATEVAAIAGLYETLRYGTASRYDALPEFRRRIAAFKP